VLACSWLAAQEASSLRASDVGVPAAAVSGVMRGEDDPSVARYGSAQQLLERFLSTMQVWPASTPRNERR
jgi:hypothetical protein